MRVIDHKRVKKNISNRRSKKPWLVLIVILLIGGSIISVKSQQKPGSESKPVMANAKNESIKPAVKKGVLKNFTGEQFKELYNNFAYPNVAPISQDTPITGDVAADTRIRQIAVQRGYQLRKAPVYDTFQEVAPGYKLQQRAAQPWLDMKEAAKKDGINLGLTAAYRSAEDQKVLFMKRLTSIGIPVAGIGGGAYDPQISQILRMTAIPGYSRHHTGYTVDISCENQPASSFEYTSCFNWLSKNNYENAKKHGWIPSYPPGSTNQGPDPESWEYVWVGIDAVTE